MSLPVTERLTLRPHELSDVPFMIALNADPEVVRYTGNRAFGSEDEAVAVVVSLMRQHEERGLGRFVVCLRDSGERIGWCGLKWHEEEQAADLGFRFFRAHWGRGYATEAARACLVWGDGLGLPRIFAEAMPANAASVAVLHKLGFREAGAPDPEGFVRFERDPEAVAGPSRSRGG